MEKMRNLDLLRKASFNIKNVIKEMSMGSLEKSYFLLLKKQIEEALNKYRKKEMETS